MGRQQLRLLRRATEVAPRREAQLLAAADDELSDITLHREVRSGLITGRA